jgi:hypothetical protein
MYAPTPELLAICPVIQRGRDVAIPVVTENSRASLPDPELVSVLDVTVPDKTL